MRIQPSSTLEFNGKLSFNDFVGTIKGFDLVSTLMSLQRLSALMGSQVWVNVNLEFEFYASPKIRNRAGMLSRDFVSFFAKHALLNCKESKVPYNDLDLANLVYYYGNLETDLDRTKPGSDNAWLWPIRATNQQGPYLRFYSSIIARYKYLFDKILKKDRDLAKKLNNILGLNVLDVMKIGACIFSNFCPREDGRFATAFQIKNYTNTSVENLKSLLTEENLLKFLNIFSISSNDFIEKSKDFSLQDDLLKKYEFNLLKRFPVIKTDSPDEDKMYIIPSLADFIYACFEGVYYILLDKLECNNKKLFWEKLGKYFEEYIGDLIKYNHLDVFSRGIVLSEQSYFIKREQWETADWLLVSDDYIVQIECKKRKLDNYSRAGLQSENKGGIDDILKSIANEADKLIIKSEHIKNDQVDGLKYGNQKVISIIVYLDEMFGVGKFARKKIKENMVSKSDDFYVLGCWEFELMCQQSKNKSQHILDSLDDVLNNRPEIYKIDFLDKIYQEFWTDLTRL